MGGPRYQMRRKREYYSDYYPICFAFSYRNGWAAKKKTKRKPEKKTKKNAEVAVCHMEKRKDEEIKIRSRVKKQKQTIHKTIMEINGGTKDVCL